MIVIPCEICKCQHDRTGRHALNRAVLTRRKVTPRVLPPFRHNRGNRHGSHNLPALALQLGLRKSHENRSRRRCSQRFHDLHPCYDLARDRAARGTTVHCRHHSFEIERRTMHTVQYMYVVPAGSVEFPAQTHMQFGCSRYGILAAS